MSSRPRLLVLAPSFAPGRGGLEELAFRLVHHAQRFSPRVVTLHEPGVEQFDAEQGLDIRRVYNRPSGGRRSIGRLTAAAAAEGVRRRPDVVLSMHLRSSYAAPLHGAVLGIPFVQYVHGRELSDLPRLARFLLPRAAATIAVSSYTAERALERGAPRERLRRIPPGVLLPAGNPRPRRGGRTFVTVARMDDPYKGHDVVLRALPLVRARIPDVRWLVVGDGRIRAQLERRAGDAGLGEAVSFLGVVGDDERDAVLDSADAFVLVSRVPPDGRGGEGFGIAFLEASARGLPVVGGRAGGAVDAVADGRTGILVDPESPEAVAEAIATVLGDAQLAERLGGAGIEWASGFAWPLIVERVESVLWDVYARRAGESA